MTSSTIRFLWNLITIWPRVYLSDLSNFILIEHKRAEIQSREVNRELQNKMGITSLWPNFSRVGASVVSNHLAKNSVQISSSVPLAYCSQTEPDRQTYRQTDKLQWKYNPSTILWGCKNNDIRLFFITHVPDIRRHSCNSAYQWMKYVLD